MVYLISSFFHLPCCVYPHLSTHWIGVLLDESDCLLLVSLTLSDQYCSAERDSNLRPKHLSLLEFETWWIRPLSHHSWLLIGSLFLYICQIYFFLLSVDVPCIYAFQSQAKHTTHKLPWAPLSKTWNNYVPLNYFIVPSLTFVLI